MSERFAAGDLAGGLTQDIELLGELARTEADNSVFDVHHGVVTGHDTVVVARTPSYKLGGEVTARRPPQASAAWAASARATSARPSRT